MPANRITRCVDRKVPQLDGGRIGRKCVGICRSRFRRLWARDIADRARDRGDPMRSSRQTGNRSGVGTQRQRVWSHQRRITALPRFRKINKLICIKRLLAETFAIPLPSAVAWVKVSWSTPRIQLQRTANSRRPAALAVMDSWTL